MSTFLYGALAVFLSWHIRVYDLIKTFKIDITEKFISLNLNILSYLRFREVNKIKGIKIQLIQ